MVARNSMKGLMEIARGGLGGAMLWARPQRWGIAMTIAALLANAALLHVIPPVQPFGDGRYMWLYARSIAYDHDIDFTNDYALCGDIWKQGRDRGGGHPDNPWYVGPSIFWVPAIEVARVVTHFRPGTSEATVKGCDGPIVRRVLEMGALLGAMVVWLSYRAARRLAGDYVAGVTAGLFAFGTTLSTYATFESGYSHVSEAVCVAALVVLSLRAYEQPGRVVRWVLAGAALGAAGLHRPTDLALGLIPLGFAILALHPRRARLLAAVAALTATSVAFGLGPLLLVYKYLYGQYIGVVPQGQYFLHPTQPHIWLLLFAPKGLFFLAPVAWISVAGLVLALRDRPERARLAVVFAAFAIQIYLSSIPLDWDASSTIGARRLLSLIPLMALFATVAVERARRWFALRRGCRRVLFSVLLFTPMAFIFLGETAYFSQPKRPYDYYPSQEALYGDAVRASWRAIDENIGALALLPAQLVFSLRYHLPQAAYWKATYTIWYFRNFETLAVTRARLDLKDSELKAGMTGFGRTKNGVRILRPHATLVFCTQWSYATHLAVVGRAVKPVTLRVYSRSFFGARRTLGVVHLGPDQSTVKLAIPHGAYESGVQEIIFDGADADAKADLRSIELSDDALYAPMR
jgi:hypothetical protein